MGFISKAIDFFKPAPSPEENIVIFHDSRLPDAEWRLSEPDFDIYSRPQALSAKFGVTDSDAPTAQEQRTAYRGLVSTLVRLRAFAIADAMCKAEVKRMTDPKEFEDVEKDHPWRTLLFNPSPNASPFDYWADSSQMRDMGKGAFSGVGFAKKKAKVGDKDLEFDIADSLYLIYPDFGTVNAVPNNLGGIAGYVYTNNGGATKDLPVDEVVWLRHRHPVTPYEGASLLEQAAYNSDIALYQAIYGRDMTAEGNVPPVYAKFKTDLTTKQSQDFGQMLTKEYMSAGSKKKTLVLGSDGELKTLGINPNDMQYIEAANLNDHQIMRIFGFPPAMFEQSGVVANSEEVRKQWMQSIQFEVMQMCSALTHQFKTIFDAKESNLVIVPPNVVPMNAIDRERVREIQIRTGQRTPNQFIKEDGEKEYPEGDNYYIAAGLQVIEELINGDQTDVE